MKRSIRFIGIAPTLLGLALPARAESVQLEARVGVAHAIGGYQQREQGFGADAAVGANLPLLPEFALDGRLGGIWLSEGSAPKDPGLKDAAGALALTARVGVQYRPWGAEWGSAASGIWLSAGAGATLTGGLVRPITEVNLGYDWTFVEAGLGVGPVVTHVHVFQPDSALRPDDANVLSLGVHLVLGREGRVAVSDPDSDNDGIAAPADKCPALPEDQDGFEDQDGCPDPDNDKDGLVDSKDRCPDNAEDVDQFQDEDGCPELDNDKDGVLDAADRCPTDLEDKDGFEDKDGCPDPDNDADGLLDADDQCPNEPEVKNGYADEDGCPDSEQVRVVGNKIVLDEKVHFQVNNSMIRRVSHVLLRRVAQLILDNPDWIHIEVEGHADQSGSAEFNYKLSTARAESVMQFLIEEGHIDAGRLSFRGFGEEQPVSTRSDEYSMFLNRRVEFGIRRRSDAAPLPEAAPAASEGATSSAPVSKAPAAYQVPAPPPAAPALAPAPAAPAPAVAAKQAPPPKPAAAPKQTPPVLELDDEVEAEAPKDSSSGEAKP